MSRSNNRRLLRVKRQEARLRLMTMISPALKERQKADNIGFSSEGAKNFIIYGGNLSERLRMTAPMPMDRTLRGKGGRFRLHQQINALRKRAEDKKKNRLKNRMANFARKVTSGLFRRKVAI